MNKFTRTATAIAAAAGLIFAATPAQAATDLVIKTCTQTPYATKVTFTIESSSSSARTTKVFFHNGPLQAKLRVLRVDPNGTILFNKTANYGSFGTVSAEMAVSGVNRPNAQIIATLTSVGGKVCSVGVLENA